MQKLKTWATVKALIFLSAFIVLCILLTPYVKEWVNPIKSDTPIVESFKQANGALKVRLHETEKQRDKLKDSLMGLSVERGYLQIQFNQAKREMSEKQTDYHSAKANKDTVKAIKICDSLVYTIIPVYHDLDSSRGSTQDAIDRVKDSILTVTESQSRMKDTVIQVARIENKQLKKEKVKLWVALGAAVVAAVSFLFD